MRMLKSALWLVLACIFSLPLAAETREQFDREMGQLMAQAVSDLDKVNAAQLKLMRCQLQGALNQCEKLKEAFCGQFVRANRLTQKQLEVARVRVRETNAYTREERKDVDEVVALVQQLHSLVLKIVHEGVKCPHV